MLHCRTHAPNARADRDGLGKPIVRFESDLYGATAGELLEGLQDVPDDVTTVMLIAHNPGLADLAGLDEKFPTGALAVFKLDGWRGLDRLELVSFVKPRDLTG